MAQESVVRLVPDETRRRFYLRVFKWVVAFATWKFSGVRARTTGGSATSAAAAGAGSSNANVSTSFGATSPGKKSRSAAMGGPLAMVRIFYFHLNLMADFQGRSKRKLFVYILLACCILHIQFYSCPGGSRWGEYHLDSVLRSRHRHPLPHQKK